MQNEKKYVKNMTFDSVYVQMRFDTPSPVRSCTHFG